MKKRYEKDKALLDNAFNLDDDIIVNKKFIDIEFNDDIIGISFDNCEFINCTFKSIVKGSTFFNCLFDKCEMSNILIVESGIHMCLFKNSHNVGTRYIDCKIRNSEFNNSHMKFSIISSVTFDSVDFIECNIEQGSFSDTKFIKEIIFDNCNLIDSEFYDTHLKGVDVSNSKIEGISVNPNDIKGLIVNEAQAIDLIYLLGIVIK